MDTQEFHTGLYSLVTLEPTKREIRLLRLLPGGRDDPVKAGLFRESLNSNPDFSVLSYSWGPEIDKVPITVQGMAVMITRNLHQCLVNLRSDKVPLVIWIDAICIHQSSNEEKNTQVPLMRDIYKTARDEYIWLGETTTGLDLIVSCIRFIASQDEDFHLDRFDHITHELIVTPEEIASAFAEFYELAWFHRTWIIQDKKSLATDPRDKIYGLFGLANDDAKSSLTIDYNKSVQEVYEEVTRYLIFSEGKLNILSGLAPDFIPQWDQSDGNSAPPGLPIFKLQRNTKNVASSWIRDFSHVQFSYRPTPFLPDWLPRAVGYDAALKSAPIETSNRQPGELGICGMEVDVVKECQRAWYMLPGSVTYRKDWDAILPIFFRASRPTSSSSEGEADVQFNRAVRMSNDPEWNLPYNPKYGASKTMKEAIWRTVIGDEIFQIA
ncbi:hypothetical protein CDV31_012917 [Fusarium ambrosium]|uniref:Heterokaryon incompatibility domain-containing protein n=1 Tax=Fusarium ambrosium TaxID=131363 RepID=A0A428T6Y7_9HYPO|nr:hypothetical protein CDV31_012917 [Fusarium ambrosium]